MKYKFVRFRVMPRLSGKYKHPLFVGSNIGIHVPWTHSFILFLVTLVLKVKESTSLLVK